MNNSFQIIREIAFKNLDKESENRKNNLLSLEKFILWIVGFSIGGIGLIISSLEKLRLLFDETLMFISLFLFCISILFGIISRYSIFRMQIISQVIDSYLRLSFSDYDFPEIEPDEVTSINDFHILIDRFKMDFDIDYTRYLEEYRLYNDIQKSNAIEELKNRHKEIAAFSKKNFEDGLENLRNVYKEAYGLSEKKSNSLFYRTPNETAKRFKRWAFLVDFSFISCCVSFLISIIVLISNF